MANREPWLRQIGLACDPALAAVIFALQQAEEDLPHFTAGLTIQQYSIGLPGLATVAFQLRHIAGSLDRLTTYLEGKSLSEMQLQELSEEQQPGQEPGELLQMTQRQLARASVTIAAISPATFPEPRFVGRARIPTTVIGLIIHMAEHTQRHVGQLIVTCRALQAAR